MVSNLMPGASGGSGTPWWPMEEGDLDEVAAVAAIAFPHHFEGRDCFANRFVLYPPGCFVLCNEPGLVLGYLIAYPWRRKEAPALNTLIEAIPDDANVLYLHDLALLPEARGMGYAAKIVEQIAESARASGWSTLTLVSVNDTVAFWARHGFEVFDAPEMEQKLASYGPGARYMERILL